MVANQSVGPIRDIKGLFPALVKIKMDKERKQIVNLTDWKDNLKSVFATYGLSNFLRQDHSLQVPHDKVGPLLIKEEAQEKLAQIKLDLIAKAKEEKVLKELTAQAIKQEQEIKNVGSSESWGDEERGQPSAMDMLTTHWAAMENMVWGNTERALRNDEENRATAAERGEHFETLFVDPLTCVSEENRFLNPKAVVSIDKSDPLLYQVERKQVRALRMIAFGALKSTLSDLPKRVWKHIAIGNVHALFSLVLETYAEKGRSALVEDLNKRLTELEKHENETFVQFVARFEQLWMEISEAEMQIDQAAIANSVEKAILQSKDKDVKAVYESWVLNNKAQMTDPFTTLHEMKPSMLIKEKMGGGRVGKKNRAVEPESPETALKTISGGAGKGKNGKNGKNGNGKGNLVGVCQAFQTKDGCQKDNCPFEHRKLTAEEAEELIEQIEARRANREKNLARTKCHECGELGHFSYNCPKKEQELEGETATTNMARVRGKPLGRPLSDKELNRVAYFLEESRKGKG